MKRWYRVKFANGYVAHYQGASSAEVASKITSAIIECFGKIVYIRKENNNE